MSDNNTRKPLTITRKQANVLYRTRKERGMSEFSGVAKDQVQDAITWIYNNLDQPLDYDVWKPIKNAIDACFEGEWNVAVSNLRKVAGSL